MICQALRNRATSSLEMEKKLALLVPGVPRSHRAELGKCHTMKSTAESFRQLPANSSAPQGSQLSIRKPPVHKDHLLPLHGLT